MQNQIITSSYIDSIGRERSQPVNLSGGYIINASIGNGFPIKKGVSNISLNTSSSIGKFLSYTNGVKTFYSSQSLKQGFNFNNANKKLFDYIIAGNIGYNKISYSNDKINSSKYYSGILSFSGNLNLPFGIIANLDFYYNWSTGRMEGYNINPLILNASISKVLFSHKQGLIKLQGFDLLKQNSNIIRNIQDNYIEEGKTNVLQQFFIIKFTYFFK